MKGTSGALVADHDLLLLDLDGVLYLGDQPVEGAAAALGVVREHHVDVTFVTNNAARTPDAVATQLRQMGVAATAEEVVTSPMAAARLLAGDLDRGAAVLVVGGEGVRQALLAVGLRPVAGAADEPVAVVQGWAPEVGWPMLAEAAVAVRAGARWVATNLDATLPSPRGPLPGNGSMVAALATALGRKPEAVGKPEPALFETARALHPSRRPLVVGDRLDTDIAGARAAGMPSLLVLTGVSSPTDLLAADPAQRPDYLGRDLSALSATHPAVNVDPDNRSAHCNGWTVTRSGTGIDISPPADTGQSDGLDGLRAMTASGLGNRSARRGCTQSRIDRTRPQLNLKTSAKRVVPRRRSGLAPRATSQKGRSEPDQRTQSQHVANGRRDLNPASQPGLKHVVLAVGQRHEIVAGHGDLHLGVRRDLAARVRSRPGRGRRPRPVGRRTRRRGP